MLVHIKIYLLLEFGGLDTKALFQPDKGCGSNQGFRALPLAHWTFCQVGLYKFGVHASRILS